MRKAHVRQKSGHTPAAVQRRTMKKPGSANSHAAQFSDVLLTLNNASPALAQRKMAESLQQSPRMMAQLQKSQSLQRKAGGKLLQEKADVSQRVEDEELMQGKFETAQLEMEEDELQMKGKSETAQLEMEEDELQMKGKSETAQLEMEEDELQMKAKSETTQLMEEDELQGKFKTAQLASEEEELLQGKFDTAQLEEDTAASSNKTGLPNQIKSGIEAMSGMSMDAVRVHYNSDKPAQLNAHAYAQGTDIHVASGQEKHLPHEAWHVVQQAQGRVKPTKQMKGKVSVNDDVSLETEADVMGAKALQAGSVQKRLKSAN